MIKKKESKTTDRYTAVGLRILIEGWPLYTNSSALETSLLADLKAVSIAECAADQVPKHLENEENIKHIQEKGDSRIVFDLSSAPDGCVVAHCYICLEKTLKKLKNEFRKYPMFTFSGQMSGLFGRGIPEKCANWKYYRDEDKILFSEFFDTEKISTLCNDLWNSHEVDGEEIAKVILNNTDLQTPKSI